MGENVVCSLLASSVGNNRSISSTDAVCETRVPQDRLDRIKLNSVFVLENVKLLQEHADWVRSSEALFHARNSEVRDGRRDEAFRRLHNALASIYTYHELVRIVISRHGPEGTQVETKTLVPDGLGSCVCDYSKSLAVVYCLRTLVQHQEYQPIQFNEQMKEWYRMSFDQDTFERLVDDDEAIFGDRLEKYQEYVDSEDISCVYAYLLDYVESFGQFHMDVLDWIEVK